MKICGYEAGFELPSILAVNSFACVESGPVEFLRNCAQHYNRIGACCMVSVWADAAREILAGYVTFSPCLLTVKQQSSLIRNVSGLYDIPSHMPCWLIGQLARNQQTSIPGLGRSLLISLFLKL